MESTLKLNNNLFLKYFDTYNFPFDLDRLDRKTIFITGGTGFFGVWLLSFFEYINIRYNTQIIVLSRNPKRFLLKYPQFSNAKWLSWIVGDIVNCQGLDINCQYIIHAATSTSIEEHNKYSEMFNTIVTGSSNVLAIAKRNNVENILLISSGAVYGPQPLSIRNISEEHRISCSTQKVESTYGEGKRCMEMLGSICQFEQDINVNYARCFTFMGPGLPTDGHFAFGNFINDSISKNFINIQSDGSAVRSYLHGADLTVWLLTVMINGKCNEAYNVGSDQRISIKELAFQVKKLIAPNINIKISKETSNSPTNYSVYVPAIDKIAALGCKQKITLQQGILDTHQFETFKYQSKKYL
jgi:nucleoside-diphosphate-sugar epimerase